MKKIFAVALALVFALSTLCTTAFAADESDLRITVNVTVADQGELVLASASVVVEDIDADGILTANDALYAAHEMYFDGGAEAGYYSYHSDYGYSLGKLWGDESGSFGYYLNNTSCQSLADVVKDGDSLTAFVYSDTTYYSDTYTFFSEGAMAVNVGEGVTLTLSGADWDADWNPVTIPVADATVTVNGEATQVKTDAEGKATLSFSENGAYVVSAVSDTQTLVPAVCIVTVSGAEETEPSTQTSGEWGGTLSPDTGDKTPVFIGIVLFVVMLVTSAYLLKKYRYEK